MTQEALKLALECAERCEAIDGMYSWSATITAIKEALAQTELCKYGQEPKSCTSNPMDCQCAIDASLAQTQEPWCMKMNGCKTKCEDCPDEPPQRKPLTDEEILTVARDHYNPHQRPEISFARAIEAAHGIKENT